MKLKRVSPDSVKIPEVRVTARFDPELWEQFQSSMKQTGQIAPIIVYDVDGELILCDGLHRLLEAKNNNDQYITAAVIPGDMIDVLTKNIFLDHLRGKTMVSEMVKVIEALWTEFSLDSEKIAEKTGLSRDYVEKLQRISQLTPLIRQALDEGLIGVGHAFTLTKIGDPVRQETVYHQWRLYHWPIRELEQYIKSVQSILEEKVEDVLGPVERAPIKLRCRFCGGSFDPSEVTNPTTCISCSGIMFASIAAARQEIEENPPPKDEPRGV